MLHRLRAVRLSLLYCFISFDTCVPGTFVCGMKLQGKLLCLRLGALPQFCILCDLLLVLGEKGLIVQFHGDCAFHGVVVRGSDMIAMCSR